MVTGYATTLASQTRGAPDMAMINEFAAGNAGIVSSIFIGIGTLVGGRLAGGKAKVDAFQNGLIVGLITALIDLVISSFGGFSLWAIVSFILALSGGWFGVKLSSKRA